ncbi:MAG: hypothetical protein ACI8RD_006722, partial [Bacillariaceae sp.]
ALKVKTKIHVSVSGLLTEDLEKKKTWMMSL